jgi:hypothetical protein
MQMSDETRLNELAATLADWKAAPGRRIDLTDPHWREKPRTDPFVYLYTQYGEMFPLIQELSGLYAGADAEQQAEVRAIIGRSRDALNALNQFTPSLTTVEHASYAEWKAGYTTYKSEDFEGWLHTLIRVLAIKLTRLDYRDDILAIQHLEREAKQHSLDFEPYRQELIRLSDPESAQKVGLMRH